jgi:hypothetical protein
MVERDKDGTYPSTLDSNGVHTGATVSKWNLSLPLFERQLYGLWILCIKSRKLLWYKRHIHFFKIVILMVIAVLTTS